MALDDVVSENTLNVNKYILTTPTWGSKIFPSVSVSGRNVRHTKRRGHISKGIVGAGQVRGGVFRSA